jgi:hypothetical protein
MYQLDKPIFCQSVGAYFNDVRFADEQQQLTYHAVHFPSVVRRLDDVTFWGHMSRHDVTSFSNITSYRKSQRIPSLNIRFVICIIESLPGGQLIAISAFHCFNFFKQSGSNLLRAEKSFFKT